MMRMMMSSSVDQIVGAKVIGTIKPGLEMRLMVKIFENAYSMLSYRLEAGSSPMSCHANASLVVSAV